jgi:hypothetical protein
MSANGVAWVSCRQGMGMTSELVGEIAWASVGVIFAFFFIRSMFAD